jgi:hypothetical protein
LLIKTFKKKKEEQIKESNKAREFLSIFYQTQEIQVLEKSNEKKSCEYGHNMAIKLITIQGNNANAILFVHE